MTVSPSPPSPPVPSPEALGYDRADWASSFRNVQQELSEQPLGVARGALPAGLVGTLYRNGPGRLERGGQWVHHPFDGDGMITAVRFRQGTASLSNRFVRTEGWLAEEKAGRFLRRGVFGTQKPGGLLANAFDVRLKNIANTHVVRLGDQLLALWEASSPHGLDPDTLRTEGITLLDGVLRPGEAFSAHPRFDPGHHGDPRMVTFGVSSGPRSTVRLMEFATSGPDAGRLLAERRDVFPGFAFLHDFAITPRWAVFLRNAMAFNPLPFALGLKGAAQCLASKPGEAGEFWLIPRPGAAAEAAKGEPVRIPAPPGFVFHHLNAFEDEASGEVVVDSIVYDDFPSIGPDTDFREVDFEAVPAGHLWRFRLDPVAGSSRSEVLEARTCEFAMVNPRRVGLAARFAWMAVTQRERGNDPLQAIEKLDLISGERCLWSAAPRGFVSEPVMVPRPGATAEDDGWVLVLVWNGARSASDLVILAAADLQEEAVLELPLAVPHGLHGSWVAA
jgi:all-trans-8'-apo-beta-carotenal 15,15'-oxygenase